MKRNRFNNSGKRRLVDDDEDDDMIEEESSNSNFSKRAKYKRKLQDRVVSYDDDDNILVEEEDEELHFEDPFADDEEEDDVLEDDPDPEGEMYYNDIQEDKQNVQPRVWKPGDELAENEFLDYDSSVYDMFHRMQVEWPCLSFDIVHDNLGYQRSNYPHTVYFVAGTQSNNTENSNKILILKASDLHKTKTDDDFSDDEDDDVIDDDPTLEYKYIKHIGTVNRIRCMPQQSSVVATWSDSGYVNVWNISPLLKALDNNMIHINKVIKPLQSFNGHSSEGYAMDWSPVQKGHLLTGDCTKFIYYWKPHEAGKWVIDSIPYSSHTDSVEDIQWSPVEETVFASCSVDRTIKIWDVRKKEAALSVEAHETDVNVLSWNTKLTYMLASGADNGSIKTWDLRYFDDPHSNFVWHNGPITSVEWSREEESVLAAASDDNTVTIWDLSVEEDNSNINNNNNDNNNNNNNDNDLLEYPPQLLFIHQGLTYPKELHWHPQIPGVIQTTSSDGFHFFKTINSSAAASENVIE